MPFFEKSCHLRIGFKVEPCLKLRKCNRKEKNEFSGREEKMRSGSMDELGDQRGLLLLDLFSITLFTCDVVYLWFLDDLPKIKLTH